MGTGTSQCREHRRVQVTPAADSSLLLSVSFCRRWLGLLVQEVSGQPLEDFLQQHLFRPLGLRNTTFYPFAEADQASRLVPLRWRQENADGSAEYQALVDQDPGLTLPRR
jgi:hypothetical protein